MKAAIQGMWLFARSSPTMTLCTLAGILSVVACAIDGDGWFAIAGWSLYTLAVFWHACRDYLDGLLEY